MVWQPGVSLPVLKEELGPGRDVLCHTAGCDFFPREEKSGFLYKIFPFFKTRWGKPPPLPICSLWSRCSQTEGVSGRAHGCARGARDRWLLFSRGQNSQDLSSRADPAELLHRLCFPRSARCSLSSEHSAQGPPGPGLPVTWWRSQERTLMLPLAVPSPSSPPGKSAAVCPSPLRARRPWAGWREPLSSGTPRLRCTPEGRGEKGAAPGSGASPSAC